MKNALIIASAISLALCAHANAAHTWYVLDYNDGKCDKSKLSPEQFQVISTTVGHSMGLFMDRITPDAVHKDDKGNIQVDMTGTRDGVPVEMHYFTSIIGCNAFIADKGITPEGASSGDIN